MEKPARRRRGPALSRWPGVRRATLLAALTIALPAVGARAGGPAPGAPPLTVSRPARQPIPAPVPPPVAVTPGYPLTTFDASIIDGQTRFLTTGPAQARCPGQEVIFVFGVVNPLRPTAPGDGAFMCRSDAVAQGFVAP